MTQYELIGIDEKADITEAFVFSPVGYEVQHYPPIIKAAVGAGVGYVVVEQDHSDDLTSLEAEKKSRDYLKSIGW